MIIYNTRINIYLLNKDKMKYSPFYNRKVFWQDWLILFSFFYLSYAIMIKKAANVKLLSHSKFHST